MTDRPRSYIAPRRVQAAFGDEVADVRAMFVIDIAGGRVTLRTLDGVNRTAVLVDEPAFRAALERTDLTLVRGHPLLIVNVKHKLIALAFGPPELPADVRVLAHVVRLEDGGAVEIPGGDDTEPSWLLFEADIS